MSAPARSEFTFLHLIVIVLLVCVGTGLVLHFRPWPGRRGNHSISYCSDNMRNLNLALFQYCVGSGQELPATGTNVYRALGVHMGDATDQDFGGSVWRCPSDRLIPTTYFKYGYSYVPAADTLVREKASTCFTRNAAQMNRLQDIAPDTIAWIEAWSGTMLGGTSGDTSTFRCLDLDCRDTEPDDGKYNDPNAPVDRAANTDKGDDVALTDALGTRPFAIAKAKDLLPPGTDAGVGEYRFMMGYCAANAGRVRLRDAYHGGRVNVSFIDGHVESIPLDKLLLAGFTSPAKNPKWTRDAD